MINGIDVSKWQGEINFNKVKSAGIEFVIIKAGGSDNGFYKDSYFEKNYEKAKAAGLSVGAYYFVGKRFQGIEAGVADAQRFIEIIKGKEFDYPVWLDLEAPDFRYKDDNTEAAIAFCETMEKAGYFCGIYGSDISGFKDRLCHDKVKQFAHWVARYGKAPEYCEDVQVWQKSSKGSVDGICGSVDLDVSYVDYPKIMKKKGLNGFKKTVAKKEASNE